MIMHVLIFNGVVSKGTVYRYKVQALSNKKNYDILCLLSMDIILCDKVAFLFLYTVILPLTLNLILIFTMSILFLHVLI